MIGSECASVKGWLPAGGTATSHISISSDEFAKYIITHIVNGTSVE